MQLSDFDYELPPEAIAQEPVAQRDRARLLVHALGERGADGAAAASHRTVAELPELLAAGDLVVFNDTRVLPARLVGRRSTGGRVEVLLAEPDPERPARWTALVNPARKMRPGESVVLDGFAARMLERLRAADGRPGPRWRVALTDTGGAELADDATVLAHVERAGRMPLPPYIRRTDADARTDGDRERYQTVYAAQPGAIAAPTAGLHFTPELLERLAAARIERAHVTLHVGLGTFQPVQSEDVAQHQMHSERFELSAEAVDAVAACRARGGRVVAVGTTVVRVLESCADEAGQLRAQRGSTDIFITPGYRFRTVDALLTNFHLPRSTLLMLVSALAGRESILELYAEALREAYRFYSYGDAMLLLGRPHRS